MKNNIVIISDHAGYLLKEELKLWLKNNNFSVEDLGPSNDKESISYSDQGQKIAKYMISSNDKKILGVAICGTGIGINISINRFKKIRAARLTSNIDAKFSKEHNNANVVVFGGRVITKEKAIEYLKTFLDSKFEGGRHQARIENIDNTI